MVKTSFKRTTTTQGGVRTTTTTTYVGGVAVGSTTKTATAQRTGGAGGQGGHVTYVPDVVAKIPSVPKEIITPTVKLTSAEAGKQLQQLAGTKEGVAGKVTQVSGRIPTQPSFSPPIGKKGELIRKGFEISKEVAREKALELETKQARARTTGEKVFTGAGLFATGVVVRTGEIVQMPFKPFETAKGMFSFGKQIVTKPSQTLYEFGGEIKRRPAFTAGKIAVDVAILKGSPKVTKGIRIKTPKETISKVTGVAIQEVEGIKPIIFKGIEAPRQFKSYRFGIEAEVIKPKKGVAPIRIKGQTEVFKLKEDIAIGKTAFEVEKPKIKGRAESVITPFPKKKGVFISASKIFQPLKKGKTPKVTKGLGLSKEIGLKKTAGFDVSKVVGLQITKQAKVKGVSAFEVDVFRLKKLEDINVRDVGLFKQKFKQRIVRKRLIEAPPISQEIIKPAIEKALESRRTIRTIRIGGKPSYPIGTFSLKMKEAIPVTTEFQPLAMKFEKPTVSIIKSVYQPISIPVGIGIQRQRQVVRGREITRQIQMPLSILKPIGITRAKIISASIIKTKAIQRTKTRLLQKRLIRGRDIFQYPRPLTGFPVATPFKFDTSFKKIKKPFKKKQEFDLRFKSKYAPSIEAKVFKIKGKMPSKRSIETGVTLRPIIK